MPPKVLEFDLNLEEIEVKLKMKNGTVRECILREFDGFHRDQYMNSQRGRMDNRKNLKDYQDVQTSLIAVCLFDKQTNEPVPAPEIREFPSKVQMSLYKTCMELCGFDITAEIEAKND